jgi:hypothetical protein
VVRSRLSRPAAVVTANRRRLERTCWKNSTLGDNPPPPPDPPRVVSEQLWDNGNCLKRLQLTRGTVGNQSECTVLASLAMNMASVVRASSSVSRPHILSTFSYRSCYKNWAFTYLASLRVPQLVNKLPAFAET